MGADRSARCLDLRLTSRRSSHAPSRRAGSTAGMVGASAPHDCSMRRRDETALPHVVIGSRDALPCVVRLLRHGTAEDPARELLLVLSRLRRFRRPERDRHAGGVHGAIIALEVRPLWELVAHPPVDWEPFSPAGLSQAARREDSASRRSMIVWSWPSFLLIKSSREPRTRCSMMFRAA